MKPYDVETAFAEIEEELIASMIRNMKRHRVEEVAEGKEWSMWQAEQLKALRAYKKKNKTRFSDRFKEINKQIEKAITEARAQGNMDEEIKILEAIKKGFTGYRKTDASVVGEFFKVNDRKLNALIKATKKDFQRGEQAILRMAEDQYRQVIFNAQVYANTGAGTYEQAVDMATKDYLSRGINCIEYKNGARHTMKDYADMAIRTAAKRAYLTGEGEKRAEWGISTVIVNKRGNACPKCVPFVGKVLIDDVYSGGSKKDGDYPLLSRAMELGLYHPRCKDTHTTYFPGVSTADDKWSKEELEAIGEEYKQEQKQMYVKRQAEKFDRLARFSLDEENQKSYGRKANMWNRVRFRTGDMDSKQYAASKGAFASNKFSDVTKEWFDSAVPNSHEIVELMEYEIEGVVYAVDGVNVKQNNSKRELEVAELLKSLFGGEVKLVPEINGEHSHKKTPDYLYNGERFDLKELLGESKDAIRNAIHKKKDQADNFIIDVTNCKLPLDEINRQAENVFDSFNTKFVKRILIVDGDNVLRVLERI